MIELWIPLAVGGAFFQNLRSAMQKHLKAKLSTAGATYVRFFYAWPFALLYVLALSYFGGFATPQFSPTFFVYCVLGGLTQILSTYLLVWLFSFRNFAAGIIYSKTETAQVAVLGLMILGDPLSTGAIIAIAVSLVGVIALSVADTKITFGNLVTSLFSKTTLIGLACGAALGTSVVLFRGAALSLGGEGFLMQAGVSLAVSLIMQTTMMGIYLMFRQRDQLRAVLINWQPSLLVGIAATLASICWRSAFTIQNAAYVRAFGQIELVFALLISALFFREKIKAMELVGIAFIVGGILILLLT